MKWGRDSYPIEIDCWHQEKKRILGKSKPINMHCKAKHYLIREFINERMMVDFCAKSPGLGIGRTKFPSQCLC